MEIQSTRNAAMHGIKILVYGQAGTGKTTLIGTCPGKALILNAEAGLLSLRNQDIDAVEVKTLDTLHEVYIYLRDGDHDYTWICLDSVSEIAEVVLAYELALTKDPRKAYGELAVKVGHLLRAFRDLSGRNVYFSAKQERVRDDSSGSVLYGPDMPGQRLSQQLPYMFDEVFVLRAERNAENELVRSLQTQPDTIYQAKDRSGALAMFEPPDLGAIARKINGE